MRDDVMRKVPLAPHALFSVQYTDGALEAMRDLDQEVRGAVTKGMKVVAGGPHAHGAPVEGVRDWRELEIGAVSVTFWVSSPVSLITVVRVSRKGGTAKGSTPEVSPDVELPASSVEDEAPDAMDVQSD